MSVNLSPVGGAAAQFFDNNGNPLSGGKLYTYVAGTTTPKVVYTTSAGNVPHTNPITLDSAGRVPGGQIWLTNGSVSYKFLLETSVNVLVGTFDNIPPAVSGVASDIVYLPANAGAVATTVQSKLRESVSVKDFGAIGTADIANQTADTAAFTAAMATGKSVYVPEGTYYTSSTINVGYGQCLWGAGRAKTVINYSGAGNAVYMGGPGNVTLIYDCDVRDFTIVCSNRSPDVVGLALDNAVYFNVSSLSIFGSGSPNSGVPADRVLYGSGIYLSNNSIIGRISHTSCRLWDKGYYFKTLPASQSFWTAAIVVDGQGELANCMRGIVLGDPTVNQFTASGVSIRDMSFQGCYTSAINVNSGTSVTIDSNYFEGNANYDVTVGSFGTGCPQPQMVRIINNNMAAEDIGVTPYGNFPYLAKIYVEDGVFTTIRDNQISISTAIPLINLARGESTNITGNRLNSTIATTLRITNNGVETITADNYPEAARVAIGTINRALDGASGSVAYTGLGFKPTSIEFIANVNAVNQDSIGWCGLTNSGLDNKCVSSDAVGAKFSTNNRCIKIIRNTAADHQSAALATFDKDGFTLTWTKVGAPPANEMIVTYIARR